MSAAPTGALTIASDYLYQAFRKTGTIRHGYQVPPELLNDGLNEWITFFDAANAKRTMAYSEPDFVFPVSGPGHGTTGNGQSFNGSGYTLGPTASDFQTVGLPSRPVAIARANVYNTYGNPGSPSRIPLTQISMEEWTAIIVPALQPSVPIATTFAYDPQWPNGVIWIWPPINGNSIEIFTWGQIVPPASLTSPWNAPPGYADWVIWELAKRLYYMVPKSLMANKIPYGVLIAGADKAKRLLMDVNGQMPRMGSDFGTGHGHSNSSDWNLLLAGIPY